MDRAGDSDAAAYRAYDAVLAALEARDHATVERSLERLFDSTQHATSTRGRALAGHGLRIVASLFLSGASPGRALPPLQLAWGIVRQLGSGDVADALLVDVASIPYVLVTRGGAGPGDIQGRIGAIQSVFLGLFETVLAPSSPPTGQLTPADAGQRIAELPEDDGAARLMLGCYAFGLGMCATDGHRSGAAMAWYRVAAQALEPLRPGDSALRQLLVDVTLLLYPSMAFERQIGGDENSMRAVVDRFERRLTRLGVEADQRRRIVQMIRAETELDHAASGGRAPTPKPLPFVLGDPGRELGKTAARLSSAMRTGDIEELICACLEGMASGDRALTWRAAALLVNLGRAEDTSAERVALAILFGKIAIRELQFLGLESIAHGYDIVTPFADGLVDRFVPDLIRMLVHQGRLGEALRIQLLLEADRTEIPKPLVANLDAAVDERCPLLAVEHDAAQALTAISDRLDTVRRTGRLRDRLDAVAAMMRPQESARPHLDAPPELSPPPPGSAVLSFWSDDRNLVVSLMGAWGEESHRLSITPDKLHECVYETLRALQGHDPLRASAACRALHDALLASLSSRLTREAPPVLVIQAAGALRHLPFGVLFDGKQFLLERTAVVLHPGGIRIAPDRGLSRPVHGVSLTLERTPGQSDLSTAHADGECLANEVGRHGLGNVTHWRDGQVTANRLAEVAAMRPTLWHLSGHFEAHATDVASSAFVLGDGERFTVRQLASLDWRSVDLVLLMGCETRSVGDSSGVKALGALDRALLHAGAGSVVSTAWRVHDRIAHQVMVAFIEGLFGEAVDQAVALQRAVLAAGREGESGRLGHPGRWGAYVLSGGWRGLNFTGA